MGTSHHEILQKGRLEFERQFKKQLERHRFWDVAFQWGENVPDKKGSVLEVEINAHVILGISNKEITAFATDPPDEKYRAKVLQKKENAISKKMRIF